MANNDTELLLEDIRSIICNLECMEDLEDGNKALHENALVSAREALPIAKVINEDESNELEDLLNLIDIEGELTELDQKAIKELRCIADSATKIKIPQIDGNEMAKVMKDLEAEIAQMHNEAVKKGICMLATVARVAIPLLV